MSSAFQMQAIARPLMASPSSDHAMQSYPSTRPSPPQQPTEQAPAPAPAPSSSALALDRLPNELLEPIVAYLVPDRLYTSRFSLRKSGTWENVDAAVQWANWKAQRHDLLSLVLTSRYMAMIARPFLYYRVMVHDAYTLTGLYRLITAKPEIAPWIRDLSCVANLPGERTNESVRHEAEQDPGPHLLKNGEVPEEAPAPRLLSQILSLLPKLRNLLVAVPDQSFGVDPAVDDSHVPILLDPIVDYVAEINAGQLQTPPPLSSYFPPLDVLSRLTSLRLYCHREDGDRERTYDRTLADYIMLHLGELKSLRTLEFCCASSRSWLPQDVELPTLPNLERLCLFGSNIHEPALVKLVSACTNLASLLVHFEESCEDLLDRPLLPEGKTLNDALLGVAPTLINLELVALAEGHYLTRGPERPRKRENHRLTCISKLTRLECLTIDYRGLFGTLGIFEHDDGERLLRLLPPNLWCFTLICEWGTPQDFKQMYLANLDMILYGVQCLCTIRKPRILRLSLGIQSWPAESKFRNRFRRQIEEAMKNCARAGIKFRTHDLLPSYRDEDEADAEELDEEDDEDDGADEDEDDFEDDEDREDSPREDDGVIVGLVGLAEEGYEVELEEEDEASEYYFSGDEDSDPEREARRPASFDEFIQRLGDDHGHSFDELYYAWHEDRWDEYLF